MNDRQHDLIVKAVGKIDNMVAERGGRYLGELGLNSLERFLIKLIEDVQRAGSDCT